MKKITYVLIIALVISLFSGCATEAPTTAPDVTGSPSTAAPGTTGADARDPISFTAAALNGPTGIGMVKLKDDAENGLLYDDVTIEYVSSPEEMVAKVVKGEVQIAALPTNLAATLYQRTEGEIQIAAVITLGVLYLLERGDEVDSWEDLSGKTLYATGQGSTPEYLINFLGHGLGAENVTVEYKTEQAELLGLLVSGEVNLAVLPEPFVTTALSKDDSIRVKADLTKEFERLTGKEDSLAMSCLIVNRAFAEEHPETVYAFLKNYEASVLFANENVKEAAALCETYGIIAKKEVAEQAIPNCNLTYIAGADMQERVESLLEIFFVESAQSVGGSLPDEGFYYKP